MHPCRQRFSIWNQTNLFFSDVAITAGGAAVYAGRKLKDSTWSCALVASKSKLMKATVPRNELSAIMLETELIYLVAKSMGSRVEDVIQKLHYPGVAILLRNQDCLCFLE